MRATQRRILTVIIALNLVALARAQGDNLQVQNVTVIVTDRAGRVFEDGILETTLIAAPGFDTGQTLGTETVQFNVGDTAKTFPIREGRADTRLLVQGDTSKEPFKYQFAAKSPDGRRVVSKNIDVTPNIKSLTLVAPDIMAPHTRTETTLGIAFLVIAAALVIVTFFYMGFRRMLFRRRMEVESARPASTIITFIYLLIMIMIVAAAWFRPDLWSAASSTYVILGGIFFVLFGVGFFFMIFLTRHKAVRS